LDIVVSVAATDVLQGEEKDFGGERAESGAPGYWQLTWTDWDGRPLPIPFVQMKTTRAMFIPRSIFTELISTGQRWWIYSQFGTAYHRC
jgi:hypothetical protein